MAYANALRILYNPETAVPVRIPLLIFQAHADAQRVQCKWEIGVRAVKAL